MKSKELLKRVDVPVQDTWDTTSIFGSDEAFEKEFVTVEGMLGKAQEFEGKLAQSVEILADALEYRNALVLKAEHLYTYAHLNSDADTSDSHYSGLQSRARNLFTKVASALSFYDAELLAADEKTLRLYLESDRLSIYRHEFEILFKRRPHILSLAEENLLAKASNVLGASSQTFSILNNADLKFPLVKDEAGNEVQLSHGRYGMFLESKYRDVREGAFKAMYTTFGQFKNTFASTLMSSVKEHNFSADVRHYDSARQKALSGNHIDESVYDALVQAVNDRLPLLHRYVELRKKVLKLDDVRMYDLYVPMVEDLDLKFTYQEAKEIVLEALSVMGDEYVSLLKKAFESRWIDPYENIGKRSGAYSSGSYGTNPYILLNWQDNLDNVYTLAHELGHSLHSYYTRSSQPFIYGDYSIFLAEVASTTNENLLTDYLLKKYDDPKIQAYILNHYLDGVKGTIYRQTQFAEFEHLIHQADQQGIALTADWLSAEYMKINRKYYGETMTYDDEIALEWARIPHFYYNYYVYQYATGFSAASALSGKILRQGQPAITAYLDYLKAGSSDFPIEVLKKAGVDMSTNQPTIDALEIFSQRLQQLENVLLK
ncbi:MAG: oligoendopeptidase F [Erysipelotrichaceae bacterium]